MKHFLFFVFVFPALLFSAWDELFLGDADPALVNHVNVISGNLQLFFEDQVIQGAVPIHITRTYSSASHNEVTQRKKIDLKSLETIWQPEGGWSFFPHIQMLVDPRNAGSSGYDGFKVYLKEPNGVMITYKYVKKEGDIIIMQSESKRRQSFGMISGRFNPNNHRLHLNYKKGNATVYLADGGKRIYKGTPRSFKDKIVDSHTYDFERNLRYYLLQEAVSPSGQRTVFRYEYEGKHIHVTQYNPKGTKIYASIVIEQMNTESPYCIFVLSNTGQYVKYTGNSFKKQNTLSSVETTSDPSQLLTYSPMRRGQEAVLDRIFVQGQEQLYVDYYRPSNKEDGKEWERSPHLKPFEIDRVKTISQRGQCIASFTYVPGITDLRDANHILTRYHYRDENLLLIEYFDKDDQLYCSQKFTWQAGHLIERAMCNSNEEMIFSKFFVYDDYGNVIQESIHGNLTGKSSNESYSKWYRYDQRNLLVEEREESGLLCFYSYLKETDLLEHKRIMIDDQIIFEEVYEYDQDHLLIEKRAFDQGHENVEKYKRDPQNGMVMEVDTGLKRTVYKYDIPRRVIKEETSHYSISTDYDKAGRVISKTLPLGSKNEYSYDVWGNLIEIKEVGSPRKKITYDAQNRPISCCQNGKQSSMMYDSLGRVIAERDYKGAITQFEYDAFGRCIKKTLPTDDVIRYEYDLQGNIVYEELPNGSITRSEYTIFKKPFHVIRADGSEVWSYYSPTGELKETIQADQTRIFYEYDPLRRLVAKKQANLEEKWEYEGVLLKRHVDPEGLITRYAYDSYGRKIEESCEGRKRELFYDELGYVKKIVEGELYKLESHDVEGKIIESSENGFNRICYLYDNEGRKSQARKGDAVDTFFYDAEGKLALHVNPLNEKTEFIYEDDSRTIVDALGNRTIERFDRLSRLIQTEKQSADGKTVFREEFIYDKIGNVSKRSTTIFDGEIPQKVIEAEFAYDLMGRLIEEIESGQKRTAYHYDVKGRLTSKLLPSGVSLDYQYDDLDRMIGLKSSDGTIWYEYFYEGTRLVRAEDCILEKSIIRSYTKFGELAEEIGFSDHRISWSYDKYGRVTQLILPDNSAIGYTYNGSCMESITRLSKQGKRLYEHCYTKFDHNQHVEEEELIGNLGRATSKRDLLERPLEMITPYYKLELIYGPTGLITKNHNSLTENKEYQYDSLEQLTQENGNSYSFDSIGNPKECEINDLNQIITSSTGNFKYDLNGNLIECNGVSYCYDALNRLKEIQYTKGKKVVYTYDPFSRLVSKKDSQTIYYLYDKDYEIGAMDQNGTLFQLKVLGLGVKGDIGAAIAIEICKKRFAPLHDFQGNLIGLVNSDAKIAETYDYTAFGEEVSSDHINPWRFTSKRHDEKLVFFGKRFYDPKLKRFLTPDPAGFADSRNLYVYTLNSPTNRLDLFGLKSEFFFSLPIKGAAPNANYSNPFPRTHRDYLMPVEWIGTGRLNEMTADMLFIASRTFDLTFTPQEIRAGSFNFFDHIHELIENADNKIAFLTFQNGINTSREDWIRMGHQMAWIFPKGTLIASVYNPTNGVIPGVYRSFRERAGEETYSAKALRVFHTDLIDILNTHAPNAKALHIAYSEGGIIYNRSFEGMSREDKERMQEFLYCEGIGPAESIPRRYALDAVSIFSDADFIARWFAKQSNEEYNVQWVKAETPLARRTMFIADHGIGEATYTGVLNNVVKKYGDKHGFYVCNQR